MGIGLLARGSTRSGIHRSLRDDLTGFLGQQSQPVLAVDEGRVVLGGSPTLTASTGWTSEDLFGRLLDQFLGSTIPPPLTELASDANPPAPGAFPVSITNRDGSESRFSGRWSRLPMWDGPVYFLTLRPLPTAPIEDAERILQARVEMEIAVCRISSELLKAEDQAFPGAISRALGILGSFAGVDQVCLNLFSEDGSRLSRTFFWNADAEKPKLGRITGLDLIGFPWAMGTLRRGEPLIIPSIDSIPPEGRAEKAFWQAWGLKSVAELPLKVDDHLLGSIGFDSDRTEKLWTVDELRLLRLISELFAQAVVRQQNRDLAALSAARYQTLARNLPNGMVWLFDRNLRFQLGDGSDLARLTSESGPVAGKLLMDIMPPETIEAIEPFCLRALDGETHVEEISFGGEVYEAHFLPIQGGMLSVIGGLALFQRITGRKRTEENLRNATHLLITLIEQLPSGILVEDEAHAIQFLNRRFCDLFPTDLRLEWLPFSNPESQAEKGWPPSMEKLFQTAVPGVIEEFQLPDGRILEREKTVLSADGKSLGHLWEFRDVSLIRAAEVSAREARANETRIAAEIQQALLVGRPPTYLPGGEVAVLSRPSMLVDGDFFDFYSDQDRLLDIVVGDVMGKGIPAALIGAATKLAFLRARSRLASVKAGQPAHPETLLGFVHVEVGPQLSQLNSFVTLAFVRVDLSLRRLFILNCGHPAVLLFNGRTGAVDPLESRNAPLGIGQNPYYRGRSHSFAPGDLLVFLSDGVTEARNSAGEMFGVERLCEVVRRHLRQPPSQIVAAISREVDGFIGASPLQDDCTCIVVRLEDAREQ